MPENTTPDNAPNDPDSDSVNPDIENTAELGGQGSLTVEDTPFAIVPEWVITAPITDAAFRVYSLLLSYGGTSACRMPSRALLARRLHKSVDTIDRALRELATADIVCIEHRHNGHHYASNRYHLCTTDPNKPISETTSPAVSSATAPPIGGSRTDAATPRAGAPANPQTSRAGAGTPGRKFAATPSRRNAARVAAKMRHYPDAPTQRKPPPPAPPAALGTAAAVLAPCGITDLDALTARCIAARNALGQPTGRWTPHALALAIQLAVTHRGWPPATVIPALFAVAADPATRSPVRLAEAGPWWDTPPTASTDHGGGSHDANDLANLEARLAETGGRRPALQAQARTELRDEGLPVTRATVTRRSIQILDRLQASA